MLARIEREVEQETGSLPPPVVAIPTAPGNRTDDTGLTALFRSGSGGRALLLVSVWFCQTLGFYGFNAWVPTLLAENGFSIIRALERSSAISIGAVPGAWIASKIADRWERKYLIAIVAVLVGTFGMIYGLSFNTWIIVIFRFLVAMSQRVFAPMLYVPAECFPTAAQHRPACRASDGSATLSARSSSPSSSRRMATGACSPTAACWVVVAFLSDVRPRMNKRTLA